MPLPFYYGWIIVAVTFVTMAVGVNARTAFSLFFPPIISEFGWERGVTAGAFSFGFVVSGAVSPLIGRLMDRAGPRAVMELGVALMGGGLLLAPLTTQPWHLYLTIGVMVGAGSVCLGYSGQSLFLPNWFIRRRGLAMGIAFAGVGIGSVTLLPWVQFMIEQTGWRGAWSLLGLSIIGIGGMAARWERWHLGEGAQGAEHTLRWSRLADGSVLFEETAVIPTPTGSISLYRAERAA